MRHRARQQTRKINTAEKLFFIALLGKKPLKLPRTGDVPAEQVDGIALGLSRLTQNKQVFRVSREMALISTNSSRSATLALVSAMTASILSLSVISVPPYAASVSS